jgi:hypothetical protein
MDDKKLIRGKFPEKLSRLINWALVSQVETDGEGVRIFFVDGRSVRDGRSINEVSDLIAKFWRPR